MKFSKEHEWVELKDDIAIVGITDYAQSALGDLVSVELPKVGAQVQQFKAMAIVDSMKASSDVYAPISGEVVEVNTELNQHPELINSSAEDKGWMVKIKVKDPSELDKLMTKEEYAKYITGLKH
ncbi:MAG TPA: glycine cleavage system protein GcvH [Candidatus Bilamarchaeaceae archaeon]|nr:glycine cleavage system protein GcvH [Candidatus Bilamarchaeaceae archaeon]